MSSTLTSPKAIADDPSCRCQNCGAVWAESQLKPIEDVLERVSPGETMPPGECPSCGALAQYVEEEPGVDETESTNAKVERVLREIDLLIGWAESDADCSTESDAPGQATADRARATILRKARGMVDRCRR